MEIVGFVILSILLLLLISGGYVFFIACVRLKELQWLDESVLKKTPIGKYYDHIANADKWLKEHDAQDIYVTSKDGLQLHGLWVSNPNAKGTVILLHGYRSTYLLDVSDAIPYYYSLGLNVLIPEHRSHGKSEGKFITFGVKESGDILQWIGFHNNKCGEIPLLLGGVSMGASTLLYLADQDLPNNVKGIVADCGFTSPAAIISNVFRSVIHLPAAPSIWVADLFARVFAKFSLYEKDTRKILPNSSVPILMIHGAEDGFVPCQMSRDGFGVCCEPKQLLVVDGADHGLSFLVDTEAYSSAVRLFVEKYVFE